MAIKYQQPHLVEERGERSRLLGDVAAENENEGAVDQVERIEHTLKGRVRSTDIDKGELVQHFLLRQEGRGKEEVEAVDGDLGEGEEEGDEEDNRLLDLDSLELLVVQETMDAPGLAKKQPKDNIEGNDLKPGAQEAGGVGRNSSERQAADGDEASKRHGWKKGGWEGGITSQGDYAPYTNTKPSLSAALPLYP